VKPGSVTYTSSPGRMVSEREKAISSCTRATKAATGGENPSEDARKTPTPPG
jgi:hypothetical protein